MQSASYLWTIDDCTIPSYFIAIWVRGLSRRKFIALCVCGFNTTNGGTFDFVSAGEGFIFWRVSSTDYLGCIPTAIDWRGWKFKGNIFPELEIEFCWSLISVSSTNEMKLNFDNFFVNKPSLSFFEL